MADLGRMTIEEVTSKVLADEHGDWLREAAALFAEKVLELREEPKQRRAPSQLGQPVGAVPLQPPLRLVRAQTVGTAPQSLKSLPLGEALDLFDRRHEAAARHQSGDASSASRTRLEMPGLASASSGRRMWLVSIYALAWPR